MTIRAAENDELSFRVLAQCSCPAPLNEVLLFMSSRFGNFSLDLGHECSCSTAARMVGGTAGRSGVCSALVAIC